MSTASQGRATEYRVRDHLIDHGWRFIMRAAASKGSGDLLMASVERGALLVQVGRQSKALGPDQRERLCDDAELIGAIPVLAVAIPRAGIQYHQVSRGKPATWDRFDPRGTS